MSGSVNPTSPGWDDPPRPVSDPGAPVLSVDGFEGPLDWLVAMARARTLDLSRLSILALVEAFAAALQAGLAPRPGGPAPDLARWGTWLVMAADLAQLRSRLLLPADAPDARTAQADAAALRRQVLGRAAVVAAADWLEGRPQLGRAVFARGQRAEQGADPGTEAAGDLHALLRACLVALRVPAWAEASPAAPRPAFWRHADAAQRIARLLGATTRTLDGFVPPLRPDPPHRELLCRAAVASTFGAALELARTGALTLDQAQPWQEITVARAQDRPEHNGSR